MKLHGKTYLEIQNAGGGIQSTTNATRGATEEELTAKAAKALDEMMAFGTTTCEAKSGYGLATEHELKALRVIRDLDEQPPDGHGLRPSWARTLCPLSTKPTAPSISALCVRR